MVEHVLPLPRTSSAVRLCVEGRLDAAMLGGLSFLLGLIQLDDRPRSYDERITAATATRSVGGIWHASRATEAPHLLYYLLMKPWIAAFGSGLWSLRLPSAFAGAIAIAVLTALGTKLFGRVAGVVAGLVLASSAYLVQFMQQARGYSFALLLTVLAAYCFVRALEKLTMRWTLLASVALVAACWMNLFSISLVAAEAAAYLAVRRQLPRRPFAVAAGVALAGIAPIVVLVASADNGQLSWVPPLSASRFISQSRDWTDHNPVALLVAAIGVVALVRGLRAWERWKGGLVVLWTVTPFVLLLLLTAIQPAFDSHYLLTGAAGLALLVGAGVAALPRRVGLAAGALVLAAAAVQLAHYYVVPGQSLGALL
jgi:mannosyltransferase